MKGKARRMYLHSRSQVQVAVAPLWGPQWWLRWLIKALRRM
ncbi:MAG: hypothetical protein V3S14_16820 [Anaerolineae bacterium]